MDNMSALGAARRRWWVILLMAALGAVLGALPAPAKVEETSDIISYSAAHTLLLNTAQSASSGNSGVSPSQVVFFGTTGEVPKRVAEAIG